MDKVDWGDYLDWGIVTHDNQWVLLLVMGVSVVGLALLPWLAKVRRKWWRRRRRHREML